MNNRTPSKPPVYTRLPSLSPRTSNAAVASGWQIANCEKFDAALTGRIDPNGLGASVSCLVRTFVDRIDQRSGQGALAKQPRSAETFGEALSFHIVL